MKKYIFILKSIGDSMVIVEGKGLKYFQCEENEYLKNLEEYLKDKMEYCELRVFEEKEYIYFNEQITTVIINVFDLKFNKSDTIREISKVKPNEISSKDLTLLERSLGEKYKISKNNKINILQKDKEFNIKYGIIAIILSIMMSYILIGNNGFNYLGISMPLMTLSIGILGLIAIGKRKKINILGIYFILISFLLSVTYGIFTNGIFRFFNLIFVPITLVVGLYIVAYDNVKLTGFNVFKRILPQMLGGLLKNNSFNIINEYIKEKIFIKNCNKGFKGVLKGIVISIPILILLIMLLSSADAGFEWALNNFIIGLGTLFNLDWISKTVVRIIAIIIVFLLVSNLFIKLKVTYIKKAKTIIKRLDKNMVNTILVLIDILYLTFTYIQVKYMFLKYQEMNITALEYSSYARSGFFQLILVVIINMIIILYFNKRIEENKLTKILNTIMTVISINMAFTSINKMHLYILEFGLTRLRFLTTVFMIFIILVLILIAINIWAEINLFKFIILLGSFIYLGLNYCNIDKIIVNYNFDKFNKEDTIYFQQLSLDCIEEVKAAKESGIISEDDFYGYYTDKVKIAPRWFEYNYYNNKAM